MGDVVDEKASKPSSQVIPGRGLNEDGNHPDCEQINSHTSGSISDEFKPGIRFYLAFSSLVVLVIMLALDGTSISVALPVSQTFSLPLIKVGSEPQK